MLALLVWAGCDADPISPEPDPEPALDEVLTALITFDGQRPLSNFQLPASTDFASIPQDPRNPLTEEKVALGRLLFHESALGMGAVNEEGIGTYSCATCHHAGAGFRSGARVAIGEGGSGWGTNGEGRTVAPAYRGGTFDALPILSPTVLNSAYQEVIGWAGEFGVRGPNAGTDALWEGSEAEINRLGYDGLEAQAIASLPKHRLFGDYQAVIDSFDTYARLWESVFGSDSANAERIGLAIAAYERTLMANEAPFQRWLRGEEGAMSDAMKRGAIVYFGEGGCEVCHTGPALNQMEFYSLGMPDMIELPSGMESDHGLGRGEFLQDPAWDHKYKVPQLYNLKDASFFGHGGTFRSIREVMDYYNDGVPEAPVSQDQIAVFFRPLELTEEASG